MNTTLPQDPRFNKQYQQHLQCLKLGGLQPKTIDAYARAIFKRLYNGVFRRPWHSIQLPLLAMLVTNYDGRRA